MSTIFIASDHRGLTLKDTLIPFLQGMGYAVRDLTPPVIDGMIDFPLAAEAVAERVAKDGSVGVILCGSGVGVTIAANRFKGVRAGALHTPAEASIAKAHTHLNVACLGADELREEEAQAILRAWIETPVDKAPRRLRRLAQLDRYGL